MVLEARTLRMNCFTNPRDQYNAAHRPRNVLTRAHVDGLWDPNGAGDRDLSCSVRGFKILQECD